MKMLTILASLESEACFQTLLMPDGEMFLDNLLRKVWKYRHDDIRHAMQIVVQIRILKRTIKRMKK